VTNTTQVKVKHGDLVITKTMEEGNFPAAKDQEFTLNLT
jgi:hypothetical protein